jgi:ATP-binding cassette, subfamily B, bacterial PglK
LSGKVTVVVVAHRLSTIRKMNIIAYIENGQIKSLGSFDEVRLENKEFDSSAKLMGI